MDIEGYTHKSMNIGGYKHDFEGFCEKFTYLISKNKRRMRTPKCTYAKFVRNSLLSPLYLLVKYIEKEIQSSNDLTYI